MRDFLLIITVLFFMSFGFFIVSKIDKFLNENYKGFENDENNDENKER